MTTACGIVVFLGSEGEAVDPEIHRRLYGDLPIASAYVWGCCRPATLDELVATWPSRAGVRADHRI